MSEATKSVGIIGQAYENRKTGMKGVLVSRGENDLTFQGENGEFTVTFGAFKSNWRKSIVEEIPENVGDTTEETPETPAEEPKPKKARKKKEKAVEEAPRFVPVEGVKLSPEDAVMKDDFIVATITDGLLYVLPDIYSYSNVAKLCNMSTVHFVQANFHIYVSMELNGGVTFEDVKNEIAGAVEELNLYGYTIEEDEEE